MATGNFYRGTSQTQDARFSNKDKKLLNSREWPSEFDVKVEMKKVEMNVIKPWIQKKITEILGFEDEVVINLVISELETKDEKGPSPKMIQINLTGFLTNKASFFMKDLWNLLLEAQSSPNGIPPSLIQEKKEEILQKNEELINQEAKLENIKAFLKQAEEEIKSKIISKKDDSSEKKSRRDEKLRKKEKKSASRSRSRSSRSRSHKRKKSEDKKSKKKISQNNNNHKNRRRNSSSHSSSSSVKEKKRKFERRKVELSSPSKSSKSESAGSSDSSPISENSA